MRTASATPAARSWTATHSASYESGVADAFGLTQRTNDGSALSTSVNSCASCCWKASITPRKRPAPAPRRGAAAAAAASGEPEAALAAGGGGGRLRREERADERVGRLLHREQQVLVEGVLVLREEAGDRVADVAGKVGEHERVGLAPRRPQHGAAGQVGRRRRVGSQLGEQRVVRARADRALVLQQREHAVRAAVDRVDHRRVVGVREVGDADALGAVVGERGGEDDAVEGGLQPLVRVVDRELLERVALKVLEPEDVEHAEEGLVGGLVDRRRPAELEGRRRRLLGAARLRAPPPCDGRRARGEARVSRGAGSAAAPPSPPARQRLISRRR